MGREVGGGSGWGTRVHPWWIHVDVWQNQYNIVKLKKKKRINLPMQEMWEKSSFDPRVRKVPYSRKWQPIPVFLPGKFHGQRSLANYSL